MSIDIINHKLPTLRATEFKEWKTAYMVFPEAKQYEIRPCTVTKVTRKLVRCVDEQTDSNVAHDYEPYDEHPYLLESRKTGAPGGAVLVPTMEDAKTLVEREKAFKEMQRFVFSSHDAPWGDLTDEEIKRAHESMRNEQETTIWGILPSDDESEVQYRSHAV